MNENVIAPTIVINGTPPSQAFQPFGNLWEFCRSFFQYREYLLQSVARDLRKQYKRSILGYLWSMLNPLLMMVILAVVFSRLMQRPAKEYALFLLIGMLPWEFFQGTLSGCLFSIRGNMNIITQVPVPKYIFPLAISLFQLTNFLLSMFALLLVVVLTGASLHWSMLALPMVLLPLFLFTVGASFLFAVSNVFFEDTQHLTGVILRALYFLCPILYGRDKIPSWLVNWLAINPLFGQIEFMRDLFYDGRLPNLEAYAVNLACSIFMLMMGLWVFKRADDKFIYFV